MGAAAGRACGGPVGRACGLVQAMPQVRHTRANPHELASYKKCTLTYCCRLAGMGQVQPRTWLAGMDSAELCKEYAVTCKKYAQNMQLYRLY